MNDIIRDKSYGIIPVFKKDKEYLFCLILHKVGHWAFPKGHPIGNELPLDASKRELFEETGINQCSIIDNVSFEEKYSYEQDGDKIKKTVIYFLGVVDKPKAVTPEKFKQEILDVKWLNYNKAIDLLTHKEAKEILKKAKKCLKNVKNYR